MHEEHQVDMRAHFQSLSQELSTLKNRVRNLIGNRHYPSDGNWKESALRSVVRRHLPSNLEIGTGFFVSRYATSTQIDILIYDGARPVLFRDGDFVVVSCEAVKAIIEVKTSVDRPSEIQNYLEKLAENAGLLFGGSLSRDQDVFVGLFAYDWIEPRNHSRVLKALSDCSDRNSDRIVNHVALGPSDFFRFWPDSPFLESCNNYRKWRSYNLSNLAFGYFIHNAITTVSGTAGELDEGLWFPESGKESSFVEEIGFVD